MSELTKLISCLPNFYAEEGASISQIEQAEKSLGIKFSPDFKECLYAFGAVSFAGHELTGFSSDKNLDIIDVTLKHRNKANMDKALYVIEEAHIDGIVIWQDANGVIYETDKYYHCRQIASSLKDYISLK